MSRKAQINQAGSPRPANSVLNSRTVPRPGDVSVTGSPDHSLPRLNEKQLADRWGVSVRTLLAARVNGSGVPFIRIGRSVRYRLEDVLAYEQGRRRTSTSEAP